MLHFILQLSLAVIGGIVFGRLQRRESLARRPWSAALWQGAGWLWVAWITLVIVLSPFIELEDGRLVMVVELYGVGGSGAWVLYWLSAMVTVLLVPWPGFRTRGKIHPVQLGRWVALVDLGQVVLLIPLIVILVVRLHYDRMDVLIGPWFYFAAVVSVVFQLGLRRWRFSASGNRSRTIPIPLDPALSGIAHIAGTDESEPIIGVSFPRAPGILWRMHRLLARGPAPVEDPFLPSHFLFGGIALRREALDYYPMETIEVIYASGSHAAVRNAAVLRAECSYLRILLHRLMIAGFFILFVGFAIISSLVIGGWLLRMGDLGGFDMPGFFTRVSLAVTGLVLLIVAMRLMEEVYLQPVLLRHPARTDWVLWSEAGTMPQRTPARFIASQVLVQATTHGLSDAECEALAARMTWEGDPDATAVEAMEHLRRLRAMNSPVEG